MGNSRRRRRGSTVAERIIGLLVVGAVTFGVWTYNGQPDLIAMFASHITSPAKALTKQTPSVSTSAPPTDASRTWTCVWDPTVNDNWHDDVECFDGSIRFRPELLTEIERVSETQIRTAAQEYEDYLNAGGEPDIR
ncbi:hypothetical protein [Microbacterium sp. YJN-G]|uniref:hypothetical protein n=1 Tax=Microbacterium sp. YJN-G TaxID=2763257 RepID=UPI001878666F|nr:hypothetical protein [Microbacterium sp. YJN-G]